MLLFVAASVVLLVVVNVVFVVVDVVVLLLHLLSFVAQCIRAELIRAFSFSNFACQCVVVMTSLPFCLFLCCCITATPTFTQPAVSCLIPARCAIISGVELTIIRIFRIGIVGRRTLWLVQRIGALVLFPHAINDEHDDEYGAQEAHNSAANDSYKIKEIKVSYVIK